MKIRLTLLIIFIASCNTNQTPNGQSAATKSDSNSNATIVKKEVDTLTKCERIDGPANVRDTVNGKVLFMLNDNVQVSATEANGNWLQVGVMVDITRYQMDSLKINKGNPIFVHGKEVGRAIEEIHLESAMKTRQGLLGELVGYTSIKNIKPSSIAESVLCEILRSNHTHIKYAVLSSYLKDFEFDSFDGLIKNAAGYEIDENWIDDPSPMLRLWLIFKDDTLLGVFHSRQLNLTERNSVKVDRGFLFTSFGDNPKDSADLIREFNSYIKQVD